METIIKENEVFILVHYVREDTSDFGKIRTQICKIIDNVAIPKEKDIVIDFSDMSFLYSREIGLIALIARELRKVKRKIVVLSSESVTELIKKTALQSLGNLHFGEENIM